MPNWRLLGRFRLVPQSVGVWESASTSKQIINRASSRRTPQSTRHKSVDMCEHGCRQNLHGLSINCRPLWSARRCERGSKSRYIDPTSNPRLWHLTWAWSAYTLHNLLQLDLCTSFYHPIGSDLQLLVSILMYGICNHASGESHLHVLGTLWNGGTPTPRCDKKIMALRSGVHDSSSVASIAAPGILMEMIPKGVWDKPRYTLMS